MVFIRNVCVLTNFSSYFQAYSIIIVAERQVKMLCENGYHPNVIVMEGFQPQGAFALPEVNLCYVPQINCHNEWDRDKKEIFDSDVEKIYSALKLHIKDGDVVLTHDLIFQAALQKFEVAARKIANEQPETTWLHLVHSCKTDKRPSVKFPNSMVMFPNSYDFPRVARAFGYEEDEIKLVPHPIDVCEFFDMHPLSRKIIKDNDVLSADVIMVYPLRLDRGKQPEICIKSIAALKRVGKTVRMIFMDFHSTGGDKAKYREELKQIAIDKGLNCQEVIWVSEQDPSLKLESPREMVKDFMCISNVFIQPSVSETFSLIAQEAMICGNLPILNFDFPPMRSIYGDKPIYRKFSGKINIETGLEGSTDTWHCKEPQNHKQGCNCDEDDFFDKDIAGYILYELEHNRIISLRTKIRKEHNLKAVFKKHLEPLLYWKVK
jgi:hypothetical protein